MLPISSDILLYRMQDIKAADDDSRQISFHLRREERMYA